MILPVVVDRLKTVPALPDVSMAVDLDAILKGTSPASGSTFVIPFRERASANKQMTGGFRQTVTVQLLVVIVIRRDDDPRGASRVEAFLSYVAAVEEALAGWRPAAGSNPMELVGGETTPLKNNLTVYAQTWETTRILTGA